VTTFIKAEEQNYSLYNYVNMLNTETDALEESNKEIKEQIEKIMERGKMSEKEKEELKLNLEKDVAQLEGTIDKNMEETDQTKKTFRKIQ